MAGLLLITPLVHADALMDEATQLVKSKQYEQAYQLLAPQETQRGDDFQYNYLLGVAAYESGRHGLAIFPLERAVALKPDHVQSRLVLAEAYFAVKDNELAKKEFNNVQDRKPPEDVAAAIRRYLGLIKGLEDVEDDYFTMFVEAGAGYDSNVVAASDLSNVAIPAFGNLVFTIPNTGRELEDEFFGARLGAAYAKKLAENWYFLINGSIDQRWNTSHDDFDSTVYAANAGIRHVRGKDAYTLIAQFQKYQLDDETYQDTKGLAAQWQRKLSDKDVISLYLQYLELEYPDQPVRDADQLLGGVSWAHQFGGEGSPVMFLSAYVADEDEEASGVPHLGREFYGAKIGATYQLKQDIDLYGAFSYQRSRYGDDDPLFLKTRKDNFYHVSMGLNYRPYKSWTIRPHISHTINDSNIPITDYDRTQVFVSLRYDYN
jgi:hypothetical protein